MSDSVRLERRLEQLLKDFDGRGELTEYVRRRFHESDSESSTSSDEPDSLEKVRPTSTPSYSPSTKKRKITTNLSKNETRNIEDINSIVKEIGDNDTLLRSMCDDTIEEPANLLSPSLTLKDIADKLGETFNFLFLVSLKNYMN